MPSVKPVPAPVAPADEKWRQQVRLACVQAVSARAVASQVVYDPSGTIRAADALATFVLSGAQGD